MTTGRRPDYYEELVESAPDAILVVNQQGAIELVNRRAEALFGYERAELVGQPVEILVPDRAKDVHPLSLALANLSLRETLRHQSVSDPLTGLYNRRYMQDYLTREIRRASRAARRVGVVVVDVDHFKDVNDRLGHGVGDEVLRAVARTLAANVREQDTVCRIGGDEFVVVLCDSPLAVAEQRAEQLREAVRALDLRLEVGDTVVTLSMGVAVFPDHGMTGEEVVRAADAAMYRAKERGRDAVVAASM